MKEIKDDSHFDLSNQKDDDSDVDGNDCDNDGNDCDNDGSSDNKITAFIGHLLCQVLC